MIKQLQNIEMSQLLRIDLNAFIHRCFLELNPSAQYHPNWHIELIASKLTEVKDGKCKRLIINIPPRNMKSICASVAFPAWLLGHNPSLNIITASYGQELSSKLAMDSRNIMQTAWFQEAFPGTRLSSTKNAMHDFRTTEHGGRMSTSVGGVITGRGAEILIIDDPMKPEDALSDSQREAANKWFDSTAYSRLNDKKTGAIIIIMQRLHLNDLVGHVLEREGWDVVSLPAIAEVETTHTYNTVVGPKTIFRRVNEPLHAAREPLELLLQMKQTITEFHFAGQYQQSPVPAGGAIIKAEWLNHLEPHQFPAAYDYHLLSWDTASKATEVADFSVCTVWGIKGRKYYLIDVWRKRVTYPELKQAAIDLACQYKPRTILIEDKSSGMALIQDLAHMQIYGVQAVTPITQKVVRLYEQADMFKSGSVNLPVKASWLDTYVHELISFPVTKHDDQVDSTTQALAHLKTNYPGSGIYEHYRREYEKKMGHIPENAY
jgi:predicted phage terminase large subunit-like protein